MELSIAPKDAWKIVFGVFVVIMLIIMVLALTSSRSSSSTDQKYSAAAAQQQTCTKNSDCKYNASATYCNHSTGTCTCGINIDQCSGDTPYCGDSVKVSDQGECIQCRDWVDCPPGKICNGNSQCVPDGPVTSCTTDTNCGYGWFCATSSKTCQQECRTTADCDTLAGQYCEQSSGRCIGGMNCTRDGDCANGYQCDLSTKTCTKKNDCTLSPYACPTGFHCNTHTMSCDKDECIVNSDCDNGYMCTNARCVKIMGYCDDDNECPPGQTCSSDGTCVKSTPTCPAACSMGQECRDGACAPADCQTTADCARVGGYCINDKCGPCLRDGFNTGCSSSEVCNASGYCTIETPPPECSDDSKCAIGQKCDSGKCTDVSCKKDSDCAHGRCYDKKCGPCTSDTQCHSNEKCVSGVCTQVAVLNDCKPSCSPGFECVGSACVPHACSKDSDCSSVGGYCLGNGSCGKCTSQAECQVGTVCDTKKGACVAAVSGGNEPSGGIIALIVIVSVAFAAIVGFGVYQFYKHYTEGFAYEGQMDTQVEGQSLSSFSEITNKKDVISKLQDTEYIFDNDDFQDSTDKKIIDKDMWDAMKAYYDEHCAKLDDNKPADAILNCMMNFTSHAKASLINK